MWTANYQNRLLVVLISCSSYKTLPLCWVQKRMLCLGSWCGRAVCRAELIPLLETNSIQLQQAGWCAHLHLLEEWEDLGNTKFILGCLLNNVSQHLAKGKFQGLKLIFIPSVPALAGWLLLVSDVVPDWTWLYVRHTICAWVEKHWEDFKSLS